MLLRVSNGFWGYGKCLEPKAGLAPRVNLVLCLGLDVSEFCIQNYQAQRLAASIHQNSVMVTQSPGQHSHNN